MKTLPANVTNGDKYLPAMKVQTEAEAAEWFEVCVQHSISAFGKTREEAEKHEREAIAVSAFHGFHLNNDEIEKIASLYHIEDEFEKLKRN